MNGAALDRGATGDVRDRSRRGRVTCLIRRLWEPDHGRMGVGTAPRRRPPRHVVRAIALILGAVTLLAGLPGIATAAPPPPAVAASVRRLPLQIRETAGIARSNEIVRQGVPLPKSLGLVGTSSLTVVNSAGRSVPAEFVVLARWNAGLAAAEAPIQWLLVVFPATVSARGVARYDLVLDGSAGRNPAPLTRVTLTRSGSQFVVNTGAARFALGAGQSLLDGAWSSTGARLLSGGAMTVTTGVAARHRRTRQLRIEHSGPLFVSVVVTGDYDMPALGGGGFGSTRRYVFTAGSPVVQVRHAVAWEGSLCSYASLKCDGVGLNGVQLRNVRDTLALSTVAPAMVTVVGSRTATATLGRVAGSQSASLRQLRRPNRRAPIAYAVDVAGVKAAGGKADGGMLVAATSAGAVVMASSQLHRNEPQALRLLANGQLALDIADGPVWLSSRQGLFATAAIAAFATNPGRAILDRVVWAPLNRPLHAWPSSRWFSDAQVVGEIPDPVQPAGWADYGVQATGAVFNTYAGIDREGLSGLTTFGLYPRYWGTPMGEEIDCPTGQDPTPADHADDVFWCATWTDYHNAASAVAIRAMQTGNVEWLDDLATPAALRMLHTQIQQCAPTDPWFYCGQSPAGYGAYRSDFNSSHAYFQNLFLYYWLTGDSTAVATVERGAQSMRGYLCGRRPASSCLATDPPTDEWAGLTGRVASQWLAAFRFVGQSGSDASFLDDWRSGMARAVTWHYIQVSPATAASTQYGFWLSGRVASAGVYTTDQLWMASLYDMENLHQLQIDTSDAPIGEPAVRPSQVINAWARTLVDFGSRTAGDGTAAGTWPNALQVRYSGARIGGRLESVTASSAGGDTILWNTGKANLTATILRAARSTRDPAMLAMGNDLTRVSLNGAEYEGGPLGKVQGLYLARLPAAVALLNNR